MNKLQRLYYTLEAVGWDNVPRRLLQVVRQRFGAQERRLPGGELSAAQWRRAFTPDYRAEQAPQRWRGRRQRGLDFAGGFESSRPHVLTAALRAKTSEPEWDRQVTHVARELAAGRMIFFSRLFPTVGRPPAFDRNPIDNVCWPTGRHWSEYDQFNPELRDMKLVWEASRFSWAFHLAREHVAGSGAATERRSDEATEGNHAGTEGRRDGGTKAGSSVDSGALFWELLEEWDRQNPYGLTVNWACGQEASFRLFAWLFAAAATLDHPAATPARLARLTQLVWYAGRHIAGNINYARSQKNNHAISEGAALWTIGRLFPEFALAERWARLGKSVLEAELQRQIYSDGSYIQHSHNYHRVMLDDVLWAGRLGQVIGDPLSPAALRAVERALDWLLAMLDPATGRVPNYGANDGALVLPLTTCDYLDYRPVAQATHYLLYRTRCLPPGPWDELLLWLWGREALDAPVADRPAPRDEARSAGGYYLMNGPTARAMIRCARYRDRPVQADQLHLDLWCGGVNVLRDAGSFQYFCDPPWQHYFQSTAAHNTVELDGQDQMVKGPRFMWLRRAQGRVLRFESSPDGRVCVFSGEHDGYTRLLGRPVHRRMVIRLDDTYVVLDDVLGEGEHEIALRWRLCDADWRTTNGLEWSANILAPSDASPAGGNARTPPLPLRVQLLTPAGVQTELLRGVESPRPEGWESLYYAERTPIPVLRAAGRVRLPVRVATLIACDGSAARLAGELAATRRPQLVGGRSDWRSASRIAADWLEIADGAGL